MFEYPDIDSKLLDTARDVEQELADIYKEAEEVSEANQYKVLNAFRNNRVAQQHFQSGSGYGYAESGRDLLEKIYSDIFHTEDALVRPQITCGTHAIYLALSANLLPGDELLYITGSPYDSLESSVGINDCAVSLKEYGVSFDYVELIDDTYFDFDMIKEKIRSNTKIVAIQRSKGYRVRASLSPEYIGEAVRFIRSINKDIIIFVDNCYGEFVDIDEPTDYGADMCAGSLIKNPGGGLAVTGGYIVGRAELIRRCSYRLTAPGLGKEVGVTGGMLRSFYQGLSFAPKIVCEAVKNSHFLAALCERLGYGSSPTSKEKRHCIVQTINFLSPQKLEKFCQSIQAASYVDSYVCPQAWDMPGYQDKVIMASGAFVDGSSIELSCDGPMRYPYTAYFQGGLTHEHGRYAILSALQAVNAISI